MPSATLPDGGDRAVDDALDRLAADEAAEGRRDRRLEQAHLVGEARRRDAVDERDEPLLVDDDEERQEDHEQQVPDRGEARERDLLERAHERHRGVRDAGQDLVRALREVDLEAEPLELRLVRREDLGKLLLETRAGR